MTSARTALCVVYAAIALIALIATWSQNLAYFGPNMSGLGEVLGVFATFLADTRVTPAARSITVDIALLFLAAAVFMVIEARKLGLRFVWAYIAGGLLVAISVTFPLFLIARELKLAESDASHLRLADIVPLGAFALLILGLVAYVDMLF